MLLLGIDIGSGFTKTFTSIAGVEQPLVDALGSAAIDSAVFKEDNGNWLIGFEARQMMRVFPERGVRDFKRHLGTTKDVGMGLTARAVTSLMLKEIVRRVEDLAHEPVTGVVLMKPPGFTDAETADLLGAAQDAGVPVLGVKNEPTCAIASACEDKPFPPGTHRALCIDVGALTSDYSLVTIRGDEMTVLAAESEFVGGETLTGVLRDLVADAAAEAIGKPVDLDALTGQIAQQLAVDLETAKIQLSSQSSAIVPVPLGGSVRAIKILREDFEAASKVALRPAVERARSMLKTHGVGPTDLARVLYTGAPMRSQFLREHFGEELGLRGECAANPSLAGVIGAYLDAVRLAHNAGHKNVGALPSTVVKDCTSHGLGVMLVHTENRQRVLRCHVLIPKGWPVNEPVSRCFRPEMPNQTNVAPMFVQGEEGALMDDCTVIGSISLPLVPEAEMNPRIRFDAVFGDTGMAHLTVTDLLSGRKEQTTLDPTVPVGDPNGKPVVDPVRLSSTGWNRGNP